MEITETKAAYGVASEHEAKPAVQFFSLKSQLLTQGSHTTYVAQSDLLSLAVKIYAAGGENKMHMHPEEDHSFIVLQGQATFHVGTDDNIKIVNANEGVMLPAGTCYWFLSSMPENLVMIRIGAAKSPPQVWRAFPDGRPFDTDAIMTRKTKTPAKVAPGQFYGV